jgi:hypothetical protein
MTPLRRRFSLIIIVIILIFLFNLLTHPTKDIPSIEELSNVSNNLQDSVDILLLDSGKIYEKDDSKNIVLEYNPSYTIYINKEDLSTIEDLFKNAKLTLATEIETLNLTKTKDKNIYTKVKYQITVNNPSDVIGLYLGPGYILQDGDFYQIFLKDGDFIYAKGKFTESDMKVIEDIYQRALEKNPY